MRLAAKIKFSQVFFFKTNSIRQILSIVESEKSKTFEDSIVAAPYLVQALDESRAAASPRRCKRKTEKDIKPEWRVGEQYRKTKAVGSRIHSKTLSLPGIKKFGPSQLDVDRRLNSPVVWSLFQRQGLPRLLLSNLLIRPKLSGGEGKNWPVLKKHYDAQTIVAYGWFELLPFFPAGNALSLNGIISLLLCFSFKFLRQPERSDRETKQVNLRSVSQLKQG